MHPVCRRGTEYACDENAHHRAYRAKVTKLYEWLQAGALHPETLRLLYDFARLKTDAAEQHAVANSQRSPLTPEQLASAAALRSLDSGWNLSCIASGPQPQGSLGSTGLRPTPSHYSRDLEHGPGAGSGFLPWLPPPTCSRPVSGVDLGLFVLRLPSDPSLEPVGDVAEGFVRVL